MKQNFIKSLIESGVTENDDPSKRRGIIFSNYVAFILCAVNIILFLIIPRNRSLEGLTQTLIAIAIFSFPILLNRLSLIDMSRLYLCLVPPLVVTWYLILRMQEISVVPVSTYDGLRIYLLAFSCIPYLLFERGRLIIFISGILPNLLLIIFCDNLLDFFGVGYETKGAVDLVYAFTTQRSIIAYVFISGCCLALRIVVDRTDSLNKKLISELEKKNEIIKKHSESELNQLNQQLQNNVQELKKREIILNRSQEIAKVGSWEFNLSSKLMSWSEQMYDIFGLDKNFDLTDRKLTQQLFKESASIIENAIQELLLTRKTYDFTVQTRTPIGYTKWVRVFGFPIIVDNEMTAINGIAHDVTYFKESEERIKANERNYRSLFEQATDAIFITDVEGNLVDVNTSVCNMFGYTKEELLHSNIATLIDPEDLKANPLRLKELAEGVHLFSDRRVVKKDKTIFFVESNAKSLNKDHFLVMSRDITNRKFTEQEKEKARYALNERVKELTTLYKISQILHAEKKPVHEVLQEIVLVLPAGWQFPPITSARISLAEMEFITPNFGEFKHIQLVKFTTHNGLFGTIEVAYLEDCPEDAEGPFLAEERNLINMIADMIRIYLNQRYEAEALKRTEANQSATINNTNFLIWSVNREYEIISYNKPFAEFFYQRYGIEVKVGFRLSDGEESLKDRRELWIERYNRALIGEAFKVNSIFDDAELEYSLSPIIEDGRVIGVSVFGEDISERTKHQKEIVAVNKQIGELRLMALRSAMNPHFIFNCLNSIQYYILENDQKNAVTYLSTFSKLIRSILNNSVKNRVRLAEELDMLKLYVTLEAIRFENKFDFEMDIDPQVDIESIEIPSMLIQPYVENAILHGLCNKKEKGLLKISVSTADGMVLFEIEDDGIGREAASNFKQMNLSQHKSMGTALTEERLKLINSDTASVEIQDLATEEGGFGTKVRVWVKE